MNHVETTVGDLIKKLRRLTPRLPAKDRGTVIAAVDAILELAVRVHQVEKGPIEKSLMKVTLEHVTPPAPEAGA